RGIASLKETAIRMNQPGYSEAHYIFINLSPSLARQYFTLVYKEVCREDSCDKYHQKVIGLKTIVEKWVEVANKGDEDAILLLIDLYQQDTPLAKSDWSRVVYYALKLSHQNDSENVTFTGIINNILKNLEPKKIAIVTDVLFDVYAKASGVNPSIENIKKEIK